MPTELIDVESGERTSFDLSFATSNEAWTDDQLALVAARAHGEHAVVVGSGNAPNILPLITGIESVTFADLEAGHKDVFDLKLKGAKSSLDLSFSLGLKFGTFLNNEAMRFDLSRVAQQKSHQKEGRIHWAKNDFYRGRFAGVCSGILSLESTVDIFDPRTAGSVAERGSVAWIHLSNAPSYNLSIHHPGNSKAAESLFGFMRAIHGVTDGTWVTWSRSADVFSPGGYRTHALRVYGSRLSELAWCNFF